MLPKIEFNIYSKSEENINAVLSFYLDKHLLLNKVEAVNYLMNYERLYMNQIEFIARKLSQSWVILFKDFFREKTTSYKNILDYGICALLLPESKWIYGKNSVARPKIKEFILFVKNTETDINFLTKNN